MHVRLLRTLRSTSSILYARLLDWEASVFLLLAGFDGAEDVFLDNCDGGCRRRGLRGIFGGDDSAVRSIKSLRSSVSGQGVSSRSELVNSVDEDQISSETIRVEGGGGLEGVVRRGGGRWGGRPEVLDASPTGLCKDVRVSTLITQVLLQWLSRAVCSRAKAWKVLKPASVGLVCSKIRTA